LQQSLGVRRTNQLSMHIQYAIVAFPTLSAREPIEYVRRAFDPQASLLPAHVTLVFPFTAAVDAKELREHIAATLATAHSFEIAFASPSIEDDGYLFLRVATGREHVIALHDRLYSGPLQPYLSTGHAYEPHITIGRLGSPEPLANALAVARARLPTSLNGRIDKVALFCIDGSMGRVESTFPIGDPDTLSSDFPRTAPNER